MRRQNHRQGHRPAERRRIRRLLGGWALPEHQDHRGAREHRRVADQDRGEGALTDRRDPAVGVSDDPLPTASAGREAEVLPCRSASASDLAAAGQQGDQRRPGHWATRAQPERWAALTQVGPGRCFRTVRTNLEWCSLGVRPMAPIAMELQDEGLRRAQANQRSAAHSAGAAKAAL